MTDIAAISGTARFAALPFAATQRAGIGPGTGALETAPAAPATTRARPLPTGVARAPLLSPDTQRTAQEGRQPPARSGPAGQDERAAASSPAKPADPQNLTPEERKKVQELQKRDREVRAHEQAHKAAGGPYAGTPTYKTVRGPDGRSYAVSGEVKIDTSPVPNNPDATIRKLEQVKRAALAPSNPSSQDRRVAAEAESKIQQARQEKREKEAEETEKARGEEPVAFDLAARSGSQAPSATASIANPLQQAGAARSSRPGSLISLEA